MGAREAAAGRAPAVPQQLLFSCAGEVSSSNGVEPGALFRGKRAGAAIWWVCPAGALWCKRGSVGHWHSLLFPRYQREVLVPDTSYRIKTYVLIKCLAAS